MAERGIASSNVKPINESAFLTVNETAEIVRIHPNTIRRLIRSGDIRAVVIGRSVRIPRSSIDLLLDGVAVA
jgi:excisionase family DNA binding protein